MPHYLITQVHTEDLAIEQEIFEADTWQVAMGMAGLGWAVEPNSGIITLEAAKAEVRSQGTMLQVLLLETYTDYKGEKKVQCKVPT